MLECGVSLSAYDYALSRCIADVGDESADDAWVADIKTDDAQSVPPTQPAVGAHQTTGPSSSASEAHGRRTAMEEMGLHLGFSGTGGLLATTGYLALGGLNPLVGGLAAIGGVMTGNFTKQAFTNPHGGLDLLEFGMTGGAALFAELTLPFAGGMFGTGGVATGAVGIGASTGTRSLMQVVASAPLPTLETHLLSSVIGAATPALYIATALDLE